MKSLLKVSLLALAFSFAGTASAGTLYWQVDTSADDASYNGRFAYAVLNAQNGSGSTEIAFATPTGDAIKGMSTDLGEYGSSQYSFYVELFNSENESLYVQAPVSYDTLVAGGYINTSPMFTPSSGMTTGFNGAAVPEPTSGVLLLIGGALLALRRRRRV